MSREDGSGPSGPQTSRTPFSDRTRVQHGTAFGLSHSTNGITAKYCDEVEADPPMAWKQGEILSPSECGGVTGSSVDAHAGSSKYRCPSTEVQGSLPFVPADSGAVPLRGNSGRDIVHDDAPDDAPSRVVVAADKANDGPNRVNNAPSRVNDDRSRVNDALHRYNNAVDRFDTQVEFSCAQGGGDIDDSFAYPTSLSEDTNTLLSGP